MVPYIKGECRLRVFENWILWRVFEPKRDENGEWRWLHNDLCIYIEGDGLLEEIRKYELLYESMKKRMNDGTYKETNQRKKKTNERKNE